MKKKHLKNKVNFFLKPLADFLKDMWQVFQHILFWNLNFNKLSKNARNFYVFFFFLSRKKITEPWELKTSDLSQSMRGLLGCWAGGWALRSTATLPCGCQLQRHHLMHPARNWQIGIKGQATAAHGRTYSLTRDAEQRWWASWNTTQVILVMCFFWRHVELKELLRGHQE